MMMHSILRTIQITQSAIYKMSCYKLITQKKKENKEIQFVKLFMTNQSSDIKIEGAKSRK